MKPRKTAESEFGEILVLWSMRTLVPASDCATPSVGTPSKMATPGAGVWMYASLGTGLDHPTETLSCISQNPKYASRSKADI